MPKAILTRKYAGRDPGTEVDGTELEINGLVVLGLAIRADEPSKEVLHAEADDPTAEPLNPVAVAEPEAQGDDSVAEFNRLHPEV